MLKLKKETGNFVPTKTINILMGNKNLVRQKTFFVEFISNKLRCYLKFENNEIFTINNEHTHLTLK